MRFEVDAPYGCVHAPDLRAVLSAGVLGCTALFRRLWEKIKNLWKLAKSERASPREIGWAVFIGAFAGSTPAVGFHGVLAVGLATLLKKNRLFAWLGARISNVVFLPFIAIAEVQVSHVLRTGQWVTLDREHVIEQAGTLLVDWCLGTIPVGVAIGSVMGLASWAIARERDRRRAESDNASRDEQAKAPRRAPASEDDLLQPQSERQPGREPRSASSGR